MTGLEGSEALERLVKPAEIAAARSAGRNYVPAPRSGRAQPIEPVDDLVEPLAAGLYALTAGPESLRRTHHSGRS